MSQPDDFTPDSILFRVRAEIKKEKHLNTVSINAVDKQLSQNAGGRAKYLQEIIQQNPLLFESYKESLLDLYSPEMADTILAEMIRFELIKARVNKISDLKAVLGHSTN